MCLAGKTHSDLSQPLGINAACVLSLSVMWALCNVGHTSWLHMLTGHTRCFSPDLDIQENLLGLGFPKLSLGRGQLLPESCFPPIMVIPRLSHTHNYRSLGDCLRSRWVILWCLREVNFSSSVWKFMGPAVRLQCTQVCSFSHRCKLGSGCKKNLTTLKVSPEVWSKGWWKLLHVGFLAFSCQKVWAQKFLKTQWSANHTVIWLVSPSDRHHEFPYRCFLHSGLISLPMNQGWPSAGSY